MNSTITNKEMHKLSTPDFPPAAIRAINELKLRDARHMS